MLRKELYLWSFAQKLYYGWTCTMTSSNESSNCPPRNEDLVAPLGHIPIPCYDFKPDWRLQLCIKIVFIHISTTASFLDAPQRWADCEIFQSESNPDPKKLNPMQSWCEKLFRVVSPIQSWSTHIKPRIFILPQKTKALLELFCL